MWSVFFGFIATYYLGWYGYDTVTSIVVHLTVLIPIIFTNAVFRDAEREGHKWLKDLKNSETRRKLFTRNPNIVKWDIDKEA
tara:strand:+ start:209 stop:454 length:246 start_codon:yes stop_codon:yes gene_type:complete